MVKVDKNIFTNVIEYIPYNNKGYNELIYHIIKNLLTNNNNRIKYNIDSKIESDLNTIIFKDKLTNQIDSITNIEYNNMDDLIYYTTKDLLNQIEIDKINIKLIENILNDDTKISTSFKKLITTLGVSIISVFLIYSVYNQMTENRTDIKIDSLLEQMINYKKSTENLFDIFVKNAIIAPSNDISSFINKLSTIISIDKIKNSYNYYACSTGLDPIKCIVKRRPY